MKPFVRDNLQPILSGKKILVGVCGGIAAYKTCELVRLLKECGAEVRVVMTEAATQFVSPLTFETLSGNSVLDSLWKTHGQGTHHIETARWADLVLIAPATANTIAKLALGMADDLLTTELLAFRGPVYIAPAMNPAMFAHPATEAHLHALKNLGYKILGPAEGDMACGEKGLGRLVEPESIVHSIGAEFFDSPNGMKALVTLGPTEAALDPVRYFSNRSSGLMGAALCWEAARRGYSVTAVCGPVEVELPPGTRKISVRSASEMASHVSELWPSYDLLIASAAVLDWDLRSAKEKLKKEGGPPQLEWIPNPDVLRAAALEKQPDQFILGFAAETQDHLRNGLEKLMRKGCDAVFVNDVSVGDSAFGSNYNSGWWVSEKIYKIERQTKIRVSEILFSLIAGEVPTELDTISEGLATTQRQDTEEKEVNDVVLN